MQQMLRSVDAGRADRRDRAAHTARRGTGKELVARAIHYAVARADGRSSRSTARALPEHAARERAVRPRAAARSPAPTTAQARAVRAGRRRHAVPRRDRRACRSPCRPSCCACCRSGEIRAGRRRRRDRASTSASSPRPTATSRRGRRRPVPRGPVTTGSTSSRSSCRRCASAATTSRCSPRTSLQRAARDEHGTRRRLHRRRARPLLAATRGRATSASSRTRSSARSCSPPATSSTPPTSPRRSRGFAGAAPAELSTVAGDHVPTLDELERAHILRVLELCTGQKTKAAAMLGIDRTTLWKKLRTYGIEDAAE